MKLLLIVYSGPDPRSVATLLDQAQVHGYTWFAPAHGAGSSGRHEGTRAWPGESTIYFTTLDDATVPGILEALRLRRDRGGAGERIHAAVMPVETFI
jgi:hypothetical protein